MRGRKGARVNGEKGAAGVQEEAACCSAARRARGMKQLPKPSGGYLFEIIMRRHELRSTMMTTNRPPEDRGKLTGDMPSATAMLDGFLQHCEGQRPSRPSGLRAAEGGA